MVPSSCFRYDIVRIALKIGLLEPVTCAINNPIRKFPNRFNLCKIFESIDINGYGIFGYGEQLIFLHIHQFAG